MQSTETIIHALRLIAAVDEFEEQTSELRRDSFQSFSIPTASTVARAHLHILNARTLLNEAAARMMRDANKKH
jgi:hypothetical protein